MQKDKRTKSYLKHLRHVHLLSHLRMQNPEKNAKKYFERLNTSQNVVILQGVYY